MTARRIAVFLFAAAAQAAAVAEPLTVSLNDGGMESYHRARYSVELKNPSREEALEYRREKVAQAKCPGLFSPEYSPAGEIYDGITGGDPWTRAAVFFLANPQLLVIETNPGFVRPVVYFASEGGARAKIICGEKRMENFYEGAAAKSWFCLTFGCSDFWDGWGEGKVRLWTVNARDAGFAYSYVDLSRSLNIQKPEGGGHIAAGAIESAELIHYGGNVGANNLSPADARRVVAVAERGAPTVIWTKFWREKPPSPQSEADFTFVIRVAAAEGIRPPAPLRRHLWPLIFGALAGFALFAFWYCRSLNRIR